MKSVFGLRATLICSECQAESVVVALAQSEQPASCTAEIPLPAGWRFVEFRALCPKHESTKLDALHRIALAVTAYRQEWPIDVLKHQADR